MSIRLKQKVQWGSKGRRKLTDVNVHSGVPWLQMFYLSRLGGGGLPAGGLAAPEERGQHQRSLWCWLLVPGSRWHSLQVRYTGSGMVSLNYRMTMLLSQNRPFWVEPELPEGMARTPATVMPSFVVNNLTFESSSSGLTSTLTLCLKVNLHGNWCEKLF